MGVAVPVGIAAQEKRARCPLSLHCEWESALFPSIVHRQLIFLTSFLPPLPLGRQFKTNVPFPPPPASQIHVQNATLDFICKNDCSLSRQRGGGSLAQKGGGYKERLPCRLGPKNKVVFFFKKREGA